MQKTFAWLHCKENPIYVFPEEKKCAAAVPISTFMYVYVSDLYIPTIVPPIFLPQNRQTNRENI
jgi:hypothetical protein